MATMADTIRTLSQVYETRTGERPTTLYLGYTDRSLMRTQGEKVIGSPGERDWFETQYTWEGMKVFFVHANNHLAVA